MRLDPKLHMWKLVAVLLLVYYHAHFKHCVSDVSKSLVCINSSFLLAVFSRRQGSHSQAFVLPKSLESVTEDHLKVSTFTTINLTVLCEV